MHLSANKRKLSRDVRRFLARQRLRRRRARAPFVLRRRPLMDRCRRSCAVEHRSQRTSTRAASTPHPGRASQQLDAVGAVDPAGGCPAAPSTCRRWRAHDRVVAPAGTAASRQPAIAATARASRAAARRSPADETVRTAVDPVGSRSTYDSWRSPPDAPVGDVEHTSRRTSDAGPEHLPPRASRSRWIGDMADRVGLRSIERGPGGRQRRLLTWST